jgi:hypothetical protein
MQDGFYRGKAQVVKVSQCHHRIPKKKQCSKTWLVISESKGNAVLNQDFPWTFRDFFHTAHNSFLLKHPLPLKNVKGLPLSHLLLESTWWIDVEWLNLEKRSFPKSTRATPSHHHPWK